MQSPMMQAISLAKQCTDLTAPNPRVGCVLVAAHDKVIGSGHTQRAGEPHAEIMALLDAQAKGYSVKGATAYVTLEPCSHHGRTGPCCDALIAAGLKGVVASIADPNPLVSGKGFERLRAAGIDVEVGSCATESRELNIGFFSRMIRKRPWVRMKIATSLDGKSALNNGNSQWITGEEARTDGQAWRARACAVLTGIGTVLQDNPRLDVRLAPTRRQPHLVVVDSHLKTPLEARLFMAGRNCYIYTAIENKKKWIDLEARGATVIYMPNHDGRVDLAGMLHDLAKREINELHVEAGERLNGALLHSDLVDELLVYLAPKLIGQGRAMARLEPLADLTSAVPLQFQSTQTIGVDLCIRAMVSGHDLF